MKRVDCPKCNGYGYTNGESGFHKAGERPPESKDCDRCNGKGQVPLAFFVEFLFDYSLTERRYWLPLFIRADNKQKAKKIIKATEKALNKNYTVVDHSPPIPETKLTNSHIQEKYDLHSNQKLAKLNVNGWKFTDIKPNPDWSFDEHVEFIVQNSPLPTDSKTIAKRVEAHQFPVRVVRDTFPSPDFQEYLLINVVKQ